MPVIVCVVGDKGGIGKSTWARGVADACRQYGVRAALFDADWISRSLFKVFCARGADGAVLPLARQDPRTGCVLYDIHHRELGRDLLINSMVIPGVDVILHDLPAGFRADFVHLMGVPQPDVALKEFVRSCFRLSVRPVFATVITPHWAGHQTAAWLAETVGQVATVIAVRNEQYGPEQFGLWQAGDQERFLRAGGIEIAMPGLDPQTYLACDTQAVRFSAVTPELLAPADAMRVASWKHRFEREILTVKDRLGMDAMTSAAVDAIDGPAAPDAASAAAGR